MEDRTRVDHELVTRVLAGDSGAFDALVRAYQRLVAGVAWRYGVPAGDVEDAVSEVFVKVYTNLHMYRPDHPFATWLYRLAVNHVLDRGRRRGRRERGRTEMPEQVVDRSPGVEQRIEVDERAGLVRAALAEVPERYREAIFLVYVEGMKVEEASAALGVPSGTLKTRLMRGREALRRILVRRHPEHFGGDHAL